MDAINERVEAMTAQREAKQVAIIFDILSQFMADAKGGQQPEALAA